MATKLVYNEGAFQIASGNIDFDANTFKIMLVGSTYRAIADETKRDSHSNRSDITDEISGTGYSAGGATLASVTVTKDTTNNLIKIDAADPAWTSSTLSGVQGAVIYKSTGTAATDTLICFLDVYADNSNAALSTTNGTLTIVLPANGFLTIGPASGS